MANIRQDASRRTGSRTLTISGTATGSSTDSIQYGTGGYSVFGYQHLLTGATKNISFTIQGSVGNSSIWAKLTAITTASTSWSGVINTTAALVVDQLRVTSTDNLTSSSESAVLSVVITPSVGA